MIVEIGRVLKRMHNPWGRLFWFSADITLLGDTSVHAPGGMFINFCINDDCHNSSFFNAIMGTTSGAGRVIQFWSNYPGTDFSFKSDFNDLGVKHHIYVQQIERSNHIYFEFFWDNVMVVSIERDNAMDYDNVAIYTSMPDLRPMGSTLGRLENFHWGSL